MLTGEIRAIVCHTCDLTMCPCGVERPVQFVRGVARVVVRDKQWNTPYPSDRPGWGRHRLALRRRARGPA